MTEKISGSAIAPGTITVTQISGSFNETSNASYAQANVARNQANSAYGQANSGVTVGGNAYAQANAARTQANTAYGQANAAYSQANTALSGGGPKITSIDYEGDDQAANTVGGQTVYILGSGFVSNSAVYINGNSAPSVTFISASNLAITTPALSTGTYPVYVINPENGATAIKIPGLIISGEPSWNTAVGSLNSNQDASSSWNYTVSANSDSAVTYALADGSSLPAGVTLASNGLISGTISSPPAAETTYTFSVVAIDAELQDSTRQFSVTVTLSDPQFYLTTLLLHGEGTNNANNHAFVDSSTNNFTINRNGNATQGSFSPFSQTGWSNYLDGTSDFLSVSANTAFDLGSGNFTVEMWVYPTIIPASRYIRFFQIGGDSNDLLLVQYDTSSNLMYFAMGNGGGGTQILNASYVLPANQWTHFAFVREGTSTNQVKFYANGTLVAQGTYAGGMAAGGSVWIGGINWASTTTYHFTGYISNVRLLKGTALYTSAFTPPTEPLNAISNTSLLTCQSNQFIDNSTNKFTVNKNDNVTVQAFSPFAPSTIYSTANVGGSMYVDGSGDNINVASNIAFSFGTDPFTVELWYYPTAAPDQWDSIFSTGGTSGIFFACRSGYLDWTNNNDNATNIRSNWPTIGQWNHIVLTQDSSTRAVFINGVRTGTASTSFSWSQDGMTFGDATIGYYAGFRIIKGQAIYDPTQSTLTVPTAPPTTTSQGSTNTVFLCNFSNAGIFDQTAKNVIETVGGAKVSTAQYKYGTGSIDLYTNTNADYLTLRSSNVADLGAGDFTVEFWMYPQTLTTSYSPDSYAPILDADSNAGFSSTAWWVVHQQNQTIYWGTNNGAATGQTGNILTAANAWYHIAISRSSGVVRTFVNGNLANTVSYSTTIGAQNRILHMGKQLSSGRYFKGYLDDVRITKGYARYTSNFTPPNAAFKDR